MDLWSGAVGRVIVGAIGANDWVCAPRKERQKFRLLAYPLHPVGQWIVASIAYTSIPLNLLIPRHSLSFPLMSWLFDKKTYTLWVGGDVSVLTIIRLSYTIFIRFKFMVILWCLSSMGVGPTLESATYSRD